MASVDTRWMPVAGRHKVDIGASLGRALKARKGIAPPKRAANLPDRDFYSFRYNFKPESIDPDKPGSVEVKRGKESTNVTVERPSTQAGESHRFKGTEQPVKEYDCVLIYDEDLGTFTLEKIDSYIKFDYDRKVQTSTPSIQQDTASPISNTPRQARDDIDLEKELERDLLGIEDAEGEPEDDFEDVIATITSPKKPAPQKYEEEEEEEEEILAAAAITPVVPPTIPAKSKPPRTKLEPTSKPKPKPKELPKSKAEPEPRAISGFEEVLDFDLGATNRQAKRRKMSMDVQKSASTKLALPDSSTSVVLPSARAPANAKDDSDSEDDWDKIVGDGDNDAQEIDLDAFEQEMAEQLGGSDDDILQAAMMSEPAAVPASGRPISLNQFAGGGQLSPDEDSTSSSDDSDED